MTIEYTRHFKRGYKKLSVQNKIKVEKTIRKFIENPKQPSLNIKKMKGVKKCWEMRVSKSYRITFEKSLSGVILRKVGTHDILDKEN